MTPTPTFRVNEMSTTQRGRRKGRKCTLGVCFRQVSSQGDRLHLFSLPRPQGFSVFKKIGPESPGDEIDLQYNH